MNKKLTLLPFPTPHSVIPPYVYFNTSVICILFYFPLASYKSLPINYHEMGVKRSSLVATTGEGVGFVCQRFSSARQIGGRGPERWRRWVGEKGRGRRHRKLLLCSPVRTLCLSLHFLNLPVFFELFLQNLKAEVPQACLI